MIDWNDNKNYLQLQTMKYFIFKKVFICMIYWYTSSKNTTPRCVINIWPDKITLAPMVTSPAEKSK